MKEILLASNNKNKIKEISELLKPFDVVVKNLSDFNIPEPIEDGKDFAENSLIKAMNGFTASNGLPTLADDSGFCIDSMNNFPGLYSARFANACGGYEKTFEILNNCLKLERNKSAHFITCLSFVYYNKNSSNNSIIRKTFNGIMNGQFIYPARGNNGFGYCPIFLPNGYNETFGEMSDDLRTSINHRKKALDKFIEYFKNHMTEI